MLKIIIEHIIYKPIHDYKKYTSFDYFPNFSGKKCGNSGCWK